MTHSLTGPLGFERLDAFPDSREEFEAWSQWAAECSRMRRAPTIDVQIDELDEDLRAKHLTSWRAILGYWADGRSVSADDTPLAAHAFLISAHVAPALVVEVARRLLHRAIYSGSTSTDTFFLAAAFAWPLRDLHRELGDLAWSYLIHAPWQTDNHCVKDVLIAVHAHEGFLDGRSLLDVVRAKFDAGRQNAARVWLEALALLQSRKEHLYEITAHTDFVSVPQIQNANEALVILAHYYVAVNHDQVHTREVIKRAAELTVSYDMVKVVESRVWDRPLIEAYKWSEHLTHPRQLDDEIARALDAGQPHHARRLAEAVMIRKYNRVWYGAVHPNLNGALERFEQQLERSVPSDPVARRASEHLALLYARTHHITQPARKFVHAVTSSIAYTGQGAQLSETRQELELFYNSSDPYHILRAQTKGLGDVVHAMSTDERLANDEVERWFHDKFRDPHPSAISRFAQWVTSPLADVQERFANLPIYESILETALQTMATYGPMIVGDLTPISRHAATLRSKYGDGKHLMEYAREVTRFEALSAAAVATATSIVAPGMSLGVHAMDLGTSLMLAFRAVARIGVVFGRQISEPDGFRLIADALAIGFSSSDGEGLLSYFSQPNDKMVRAVSIGAVTYSASRMVEYLWTSSNHEGGVSRQAIEHISRLCGMQLSEQRIARAVPILGAVVSGVSTYAFMSKIIDTAIHIAARDALVVRANVYDQNFGLGATVDAT